MTPFMIMQFQEIGVSMMRVSQGLTFDPKQSSDLGSEINNKKSAITVMVCNMTL